MAYKPPYTITSTMLNYITSVMKLVGQLTNDEILYNRTRLTQTNKEEYLKTFLSSENIEFSGINIVGDMNINVKVEPGLIPVKLKNATKLYDSIHSINPYDSMELLKYHRMMNESLTENSGSFRLQKYNIIDKNDKNVISISASKVLEYMEDLYDYLNNYEENILIKACVFLYEFEYIQPFSDGNSRMGRLFQTSLLILEDKVFSYLPIETIVSERNQEYYNALDASHKNRNSNVFIEFMLDVILEGVKRVIKVPAKEPVILGIHVKKLLNIMKEGIPYSTKELLELLQMKSRASFKKNYLDPAMYEGLVVMTIPDRPNSRNQRYILK